MTYEEADQLYESMDHVARRRVMQAFTVLYLSSTALTFREALVEAVEKLLMETRGAA